MLGVIYVECHKHDLDVDDECCYAECHYAGCRDTTKKVQGSGLYYRNITNVNDTFSVIRMTIISDATTWSITYDHN